MKKVMSPQVYAGDLSRVTGRGASQRQRAIECILQEDFRYLRLSYRPKYNPFIRTGIAKQAAGTQIGKASFASRAALRDVIVHEELHHRWWARGIYDHHPVGSAMQVRFYETVVRYKRVRAWYE